mmetsp:Transcript_5033/g.7632  ORF Transcript_5033/g.7632 Transcript_5033/m.7632 type:complete len:225 (+) Transcript_5033:86-760(+)
MSVRNTLNLFCNQPHHNHPSVFYLGSGHRLCLVRVHPIVALTFLYHLVEEREVDESAHPCHHGRHMEEEGLRVEGNQHHHEECIAVVEKSLGHNAHALLILHHIHSHHQTYNLSRGYPIVDYHHLRYFPGSSLLGCKLNFLLLVCGVGAVVDADTVDEILVGLVDVADIVDESVVVVYTVDESAAAVLAAAEVAAVVVDNDFLATVELCYYRQHFLVPQSIELR